MGIKKQEAPKSKALEKATKEKEAKTRDIETQIKGEKKLDKLLLIADKEAKRKNKEM